jgi:hypothetical protein
MPDVPAKLHYRFGDLTRGLIHWLGPHAQAVRGKIDWLKFGKAVVLALVAGQAVDLAGLVGMLVGAVSDPAVAARVSGVVTVLIFVVEQGRRLLQDGKDAPPRVPPAGTR